MSIVDKVPASIVALKNDYFQKHNYVGCFIDSCTTNLAKGGGLLGDEDMVTSRELFEGFKGYCHGVNARQGTLRDFKDAVSKIMEWGDPSPGRGEGFWRRKRLLGEDER